MPTDNFILIPETTLPNGHVVPAFRVGRYLCSCGADGKAQVTAEGVPWVRINYHEAREACAAAGYALITETQALALAWHLANQPGNWTGGAVGEGDLYQGLRDWSVSEAQPGTYAPADDSHRRWFVTADGERIYDAAGNAYTWVFDDVQGGEAGLVAKPFAADSVSLSGPAPSMEKGCGWRPDADADWSGDALIRGGDWRGDANAGVFHLAFGWPDRRFGDVGFRCTQVGL